MKIAFLLFALILSVPGWCASGIPSERITRAVTPNDQPIGNEKTQEGIKRLLQEDKAKTVLIGWIVITYLTAITWWAIAAKSSLDNILKEVLKSLARYS